MPVNTRWFQMADRLTDGNLERTLLDMRDKGMSHQAISDALDAEHGIDVTRQTVAKWLAILTAHRGAA